MTDFEYFAKNLKFLRQQKGFKQEDIASMFFVTSQAVSKWETAKSLPDIKTLIKIAEYFEVSVEDLISKDIALCEPKENDVDDDDPFFNGNKTNLNNVSSIIMNYNVKESKATKAFWIFNLILVIVTFCSYIFWFLPADDISAIIIIVVSIVNLFGIISFINAMVKIKRHVLIRGESYQRFLKVVAPINFAAAIWFVGAAVILGDFADTQNFMALYILYAVLYLFIGFGTCFANVFYHKVEEEQ